VPIVATARLRGRVAPADLGPGTLRGSVVSGSTATLFATVARDVVESFSGPSLCYTFAVKLHDEWIPRTELLGPFELDESIDTVAVLFSFGLSGRRWSIEASSWVWSRTPVEIWATAGPAGGLRTWLRAFGYVLTCDQQEGPEPVLKVSCGDPSILYAREQLCAEVPTGAGLSRGAICADLLADLGIDSDIPAGAIYAKSLVTDSARLWDFLAAFGEPEDWHWRFIDDATVQAYTATLRVAPEPSDDIWSLADVVSIQSAPPSESPARYVLRSTELVDGAGGVKIEITRIEVKGLFAPVVAPNKQNSDGSITSLGVSTGIEVFRTISVQEVEKHTLGTTVVYTVTRDFGWYNPRAAKLRSLGLPAGPVEDGYYYAVAWLDPDGTYRAGPQQTWVQTGEIRVTPTYDGDGTEISTHTETYRWRGIPMATRAALSDHPSVLNAAVGDDDLSWQTFNLALVSAGIHRIEEFGLAQVDDVTHEFGAAGAEVRQIEETSTWYAARSGVTINWLNYSGQGMAEMVAPFRLTRRVTTDNLLTADALLAGTIETQTGFGAPHRLGTLGVYDWGDGASSNQATETFQALHSQITTYNVVDEQTYEKLVDGRRELLNGRPPRPRFRASTWTQTVQAPLEVLLEDPAAAAWWGGETLVIDQPYVQNRTEGEAVARRRRKRAVRIQHTVVRPVCQVRPGQTVLLLDPRSGIAHRCLVVTLKETWTLAPRPQILATYTLEQPL